MANKCSCGTWNNDSAKYCRNCGKKLTISSPHTQPSNHSSTKYETSGTSSSGEMGVGGKIILTIIGIAAFIGISVATGGIGSISGVVLGAMIWQIWKD